MSQAHSNRTPSPPNFTLMSRESFPHRVPPQHEEFDRASQITLLHPPSVASTQVWEPPADDAFCLRIVWVFVRERDNQHPVEVLVTRLPRDEVLAQDEIFDLPSDLPLSLRFPDRLRNRTYVSHSLLEEMALRQLQGITGHSFRLEVKQARITIRYASRTVTKTDISVTCICPLQSRLSGNNSGDAPRGINFEWKTWAQMRNIQSREMSEDLRRLIKGYPEGITDLFPNKTWLPRDFRCSIHPQDLHFLHPIRRKEMPIFGSARFCLLIVAEATEKVMIFRHEYFHGGHSVFDVPGVDPLHCPALELETGDPVQRMAKVAFKQATGADLTFSTTPKINGPDICFGQAGAEGGIHTVVVLGLQYKEEEDVPVNQPDVHLSFGWYHWEDLDTLERRLGLDISIIRDTITL
ncbi:hypothetical protein T439DRAFT_98285 [Meredithblackwellia eburnea MCA 4105]